MDLKERVKDMIINENVNINSQVVVKNSFGNDVTVVHMNAILDASNSSVSCSCNTVNKELAKANEDEVKLQLEGFWTIVRQRAESLDIMVF